jgi:hypothetical protein
MREIMALFIKFGYIIIRKGEPCFLRVSNWRKGGQRGVKKMERKFLAGFLLLFFLTGCLAMEPIEVREKAYGKGVPVISQSFASPKIRVGQTWKVYLTASESDGEMKNIVSVIDQPGVGTYPVSITRIKKEDRRELSGYVYLNTPVGAGFDFVNLTLHVQIEDRAGHYSKPVSFPLNFSTRDQQEPPPQGLFKEKDLGPILTQLRTIMGGDNPNDFR